MTPLELALAAGWICVSGLATLASALYLRGLGTQPPADDGPFPAVLVLLPVRCTDAAEAASFAACLAAVAAQDYPGPWRLAVILEDSRDPGWPVAMAADPARVTVLAAGPTPGRAQKLHNLLAGLATRRAEEAILVTLDADTRPLPSWLGELTRPLRRGLAEAANGYRWPIGTGLAARLVALADRAPGTTHRPIWFNMAWGGSTALTATALARLDLPRLWDRAVSDDLTLSAALRRADMRPFAPRRVLVPTPLPRGTGALLRFWRRQLLLLRLHAPGYWLLLAVIMALPLAGAVAVLAAMARGSLVAPALLVAGLGLQQLRASLRVAIGGRVLPPAAAAAIRRSLPLDRLLLPLLPAIHLALMLSVLRGRRIDWGGRRYLVEAPDRVRLLPGA